LEAEAAAALEAEAAAASEAEAAAALEIKMLPCGKKKTTSL